MKAAVIHGPGKVTCDSVDDPKIKDARDVILKVTATAICGSDLHIYSGGIPQPRPMVLGHEFMGIVEDTGSRYPKFHMPMKYSIRKKMIVSKWYSIRGSSKQNLFIKNDFLWQTMVNMYW